ncbi:MAG: hypothetical protein R3B93_21090 [Bacteroidia bacterium]
MNNFPEISFENRSLSAPVTDNNALLITYRDQLRQIKESWPDKPW